MNASLLVDCLIAGRYLLHRPPVAVRVVEEHEPHVVEVILVPGRAGTRGADHLGLANFNPALDELGPRRADVPDHQLQALERAGLHVRDTFAHDDRASRSRRGQLHDVVLVADPGVMVYGKAELLGVEGFGAVHLGDRYDNHFQRPVHGCPSFGFTGLESPAGLAEWLALAETEDLPRGDLVHSGRTRVRLPQRSWIVVEAAVAHRETPIAAVLRQVSIRHAPEPRLVGHPHRVAFDHHVEALVERVASGREDTVGITHEVLRLAFVRASAEVQRAVQPDGQQRRDVRPSVRAHRRDPVHLRPLQTLATLRPRYRGRLVAAEL